MIEQPLTVEQQILSLVGELQVTMGTAEALSYLRRETKYTEGQIKSALDGYPYHVATEAAIDKVGRRLLDSYEIRNFYDGNLMGKLLTVWTYWETGSVRDMTIDDGIGAKRRTIVHHRSNSEPESVEVFAIEPSPTMGETVINRILGTSG